MEQKIEAVMTTQVVTATPATPFRELVELLGQRRISALPVIDDDRRVVGIVSEADLLIKEGWPHGGDDAGVLEALRHRHRFDKGAGTCAEEVMTRKVVTVALGTPLAAAARLMIRLGVKRLPVVDAQGRLAGIVTRGDLLKAFLRPDPAIAWEIRHELLRDRFADVGAHVEVEVHDGTVGLTGGLERRSQVDALVRAVQAVEGVAAVNAKLTWEIDDVTAMATWPIA
ncbi:MAG TPA: CBS domain-containing protein [Actinomycetes bacterium]